MKKRVPAVLIALSLLLFALTSCGSKIDVQESTPNPPEEKSENIPEETGVQQEQAAESDVVREFWGYVIDKCCFEIPGPEEDTWGCLLMDSCRDSGYGLAIPDSSAPNGYIWYAFDDAGDAAALALLKDIEAQGVKSYISVKVTGNLDETTGSYDWAFGEKGGTIDYQGTISDVTVTYDATHADFAAKAVELTGETVVEVSDAVYTGSTVVSDVVVKDGDYTLKAGFDYNVECENNVEVGTAKVTISGVGAFYKGTMEKTFAILEAAGAYYTDAVAWAASAGITTGDSETTFNPDGSCTCMQIVTFLYRQYGK